MAERSKISFYIYGTVAEKFITPLEGQDASKRYDSQMLSLNNRRYRERPGSCLTFFLIKLNPDLTRENVLTIFFV